MAWNLFSTKPLSKSVSLHIWKWYVWNEHFKNQGQRHWWVKFFIIFIFSQNNEGEIQPGYEDLVLNVTHNFHNLGSAPGSSIITLDVNLAVKNEFKCEVLLRNHQYCVNTTRIEFKGKFVGGWCKVWKSTVTISHELQLGTCETQFVSHILVLSSAS